jgi:uncharacterized repeat protein (TIGR03803 family)
MQHTSSGWHYHTLYSFAGPTTDGDYPYGGLIFDRSGNLYGATLAGGSAYSGTVFELKRSSSGWTESVLYNFQGTADGVNPNGPLVMDSSGNLFGTTGYGGDTSCGQGYGCGEVFELSPGSGGVWTKTTVYAFTGSPDGHAPQTGMIFDKAGNLLGTTLNGGTNDSGAVFELTPKSGGGWTESVVYSFLYGSDGGYPSTPLIIDGAGNIYGTAQFGGTYNEGVAFEFTGVVN